MPNFQRRHGFSGHGITVQEQIWFASHTNRTKGCKHPPDRRKFWRKLRATICAEMGRPHTGRQWIKARKEARRADAGF